MKIPPVLCLVVLGCVLAPAQTSTLDVGSGAPNDAVHYSFGAAYFRNRFYAQLSLPPLGEVKKFGATGLVQEFADAAKTTGVKFALIKPNIAVQANDGSDVFQLTGIVYAYYSSVGVTTAGQPTGDTINCPDGPCQYQFYDKNYALFASPGGQNFTIRDPFFTKWTALGGVPSFGSPISAEQSVTSPVSSATATVQTYSRGALYNITSGALNGRLIPVSEPVYDLYSANGAHSGFLGFPAGEPISLPGGGHRQSFEGGSIDYADNTTPVLRLPVSNVTISSGGSTVRLNLGDTLNVKASTFGANGIEFTNRSTTFVTTNSRVIGIQQSGATAVLLATGGGTAKVTAVTEGKTSPAITFFVTAPCCAAGEGAATPAIQQIFQDAVARSGITVRLPAASPVQKIGAGLVQEFQGVDPNSAVRYLVAVPDRAAVGYVVTGAILSKYEEQGGPGQALGYPAADAVYDAARIGRQVFEGGAIAGSPLRVVAGAFLQKWASLNYEAGPLGQPAGDAGALLTFTGIPGRVQAFQNGTLYGASSGPQAGKVYFVSGLIRAKYDSLGAGSGQLGLPITDESAITSKRHQDFEGGFLEYVSGDSEAKLTARDRKPGISAAPGTVAAGTRVRTTVAGFANGSTLRVSISGQPDFIVKTQTGSYFWDSFVPANAATGAVTIHAVDTANASATADGSYSVRSSADVHAQIVKLRGDAQSAPPGAQAPQALRIAVRDDAGNPLAAVPVKFSASPGAAVSPAIATTDINGEAETFLRLPPNEGIVLATAEAVRQVATFSLRAAKASLPNYTQLSQSGTGLLGNGPATIAQKGSLLTAVAAMIRYYQTRGDLAMPNGVADPGALNEFLKSRCNFDAQGAQVCDGFVSPKDSKEQFVNLWRLADFVGNNLDVSVESAQPSAIRDLLTQNDPVLLGLGMTSNGVAAGVHFVAAIGISSDGTILIHDPNPAFGRASLTEYLNGFPAGGANWKGALTSAVRLLPRTPSGTGFVIVTATDKLSVASQAGDCGSALEWPNIAATASSPGSPSGAFRQRYCDGTQPAYEIDLAGTEPYDATVTDLGNLGGKVDLKGASSFKATRPGPHLVVGPQDVQFSSKSVVNAATFTPDMAPGGLIAIFGEGLATRGGITKVEISNLPVNVTAAYPFQVNVQIPSNIALGVQPLKVTSPFGVTEATIQIQAAAPAVFRLDPASVGLERTAVNKGAAINQDGKLNLPSNPGRRGAIVTVFGTGFGTVNANATPATITAPITASMAGQQAPVTYAGLTPGFIGLYQVNVAIPSSLPPGLELLVSFQVGGVDSRPVEIAVQ